MDASAHDYPVRIAQGILQTEETSVKRYLRTIFEEETAVDSIAGLINAECQ